MITTPHPAECEKCGRPATVQLLDTWTHTDHYVCREHRPERTLGERNPRFVMERSRSAPDCPMSRRWEAPRESPEHQSFREHMCEMGLLDAEGACRYYLSVITGINHFALWRDEFLSNLWEYVISRTCEEAAELLGENECVSSVTGLLRRESERFEGKVANRRVKKQERAIEVLLNHPDWTDEQVAAEVPTTVKQLGRWTDYQMLRIAPKRRCAREAGE